MNQINEKISPFEIGVREWDLNELFNHIKRLQKVWSWGAHNWRTIGQKALRFTVQGRLFRGHVYISLAANDTFTIYYTTNRGTIKEITTDIYIDMLIDTIDKYVEYIPDYGNN